ncbi:SgcJ/EcaC family oxidoreductase [Flaviflexus ciconiae]|uniref:SgcJ/EcaC family oxidoreductase n=1 Tax=Flaviflexus ciconiae TaxID=2496867 RepID=A0A3Q9G363_9ACTO|nr:SgcJ/EcaC family oxidoreductase [Flaviflexus ciconiae]AZQ76270.1 SgcJ/EcaC family oxidoreductase [Flaviflexus ciconiae]
MTDVSLPDSPKGVLHAFRDAWNRHDADELASIFAPDATFVNVTGLWWNTREKIKTAHAYGFEKIFGQSSMRVGRTTVKTLGDDHAVVVGRLIVTGQVDPDGRELDERRTVLTVVAQKLAAGIWRAVSAQNTDIPPGGMETHANVGSTQSPITYRGSTPRH